MYLICYHDFQWVLILESSLWKFYDRFRCKHPVLFPQMLHYQMTLITEYELIQESLRMPQLEQDMFNLPGHLRSPLFCWGFVAQSLFSFTYVLLCLSFVVFSCLHVQWRFNLLLTNEFEYSKFPRYTNKIDNECSSQGW